MRHALAVIAIVFSASGCGDGGDGEDLDNDVPATQDALFEFLRAGQYKDFVAESAQHPSSGPHSGDVRVFLNPALDASLKAKNTSHPKGAAAVKELGLGEAGEPSGWAVLVKTDDDSRGGDGIYWYEIFSTTDGANPPYAGNGENICKNCHIAGLDHYLSAYPLE